MQPFRVLAAVVAASFAFGAVLARANDTPAQAAARAALQQQMNQMENEQPPGSTNTPPAAPSEPPAAPSEPPETPTAPPEAVKPSQPLQPPPIVTPTPQFSTNIPVTPELESQMAPAKMSQTNEPATAEMNTRTTLPNLTVPPAVLMTNEAAQYPVNPPMAPLPPPPVEAPSTQPPTTPELHPASANPTASPQNPEGGPNIQEPPSTNSVPNYDGGIKAPPLPINQEQQAELHNLLQQYMANQITPAQYQERRAQIIGQQ